MGYRFTAVFVNIDFNHMIKNVALDETVKQFEI